MQEAEKKDESEARGGVWRRARKLIKLLLALLTLALLITTVGMALLAPRIKDGIVSAIEQRTNRRVEIAELGWSFWPQLQFRGAELEIGNPGDRDATSFRVGSFSVNAPLSRLISRPRTIGSLELSELRATIAPLKTATTTPTKPQKPRSMPGVSIESIVASDIRIEILSSQLDKEPRIFQIDRLEFGSFDLRSSIPFKANLAYARPTGPLEVAGQFGPVNESEPRLTPYAGDFSFLEVDLGDFGGISGLLTATGSFQGMLLDTQARGSAQIPDFAVTRVGNIVPLENRFEVAVRENGAIIELVQVETSFLESRLATSGSISRIPGGEGREVVLHVEAESARIEDLLQFAIKTDSPPLTGAIELNTDVRISPGAAGFSQRMEVKGDFLIREGRFSNVNIQQTLEKISRIGSKESAPEEGDSLVSDMNGQFHLAEGRIEFSQLEFSVPGMQVALTGSYLIEGEVLDFRGQAALERAPSELAPEKLSDWLKVLDPILQRGQQGTVVPIKITGTRSQPKFAVDVLRLFK